MSRAYGGRKGIRASKVKRFIEGPGDYTKTRTLTDWLFVKYGISYKTYRNKSPNRRNELRKEFEEDTGCKVDGRKENTYYDRPEDLYALLAEVGVPFDEDDEPLGIG